MSLLDLEETGEDESLAHIESLTWTTHCWTWGNPGSNIPPLIRSNRRQLNNIQMWRSLLYLPFQLLCLLPVFIITINIIISNYHSITFIIIDQSHNCCVGTPRNLSLSLILIFLILKQYKISYLKIWFNSNCFLYLKASVRAELSWVGQNILKSYFL